MIWLVLTPYNGATLSSSVLIDIQKKSLSQSDIQFQHFRKSQNNDYFTYGIESSYTVAHGGGGQDSYTANKYADLLDSNLNKVENYFSNNSTMKKYYYIDDYTGFTADSKIYYC